MTSGDEGFLTRRGKEQKTLSSDSIENDQSEMEESKLSDSDARCGTFSCTGFSLLPTDNRLTFSIFDLTPDELDFIEKLADRENVFILFIK